MQNFTDAYKRHIRSACAMVANAAYYEQVSKTHTGLTRSSFARIAQGYRTKAAAHRQAALAYWK